VQVADRWHLMESASAASLNAVRRSMHAIHKAVGVGTIARIFERGGAPSAFRLAAP
jgi:hypothetical protein